MSTICPNCRGWKDSAYALCWSCQKEINEHGREEVQVAYQKVVHETDKAWRVVIDDSDPFQPKACWVPKSIGELDEEACEVWVPRWFAEQEDLEALND